MIKKYSWLVLLCINFNAFAADLYNDQYVFSCTISNANTKQVIKVLPGQLDKTSSLAHLNQTNLETAANGILATDLCVASGFPMQGTLTNVPSISNSNSNRGVKVLQQYPSPLCVVACKLINSP